MRPDQFGREMRSFLMRASSVVRLRPRILPAPYSPCSTSRNRELERVRQQPRKPKRILHAPWSLNRHREFG